MQCMRVLVDRDGRCAVDGGLGAVRTASVLRYDQGFIKEMICFTHPPLCLKWEMKKALDLYV